MKHSLLLILSLVYALTCSAQNDKWKCKAKWIALYEFEGVKSNSLQWDSCNLIVVFDGEEDQIRIYSKKDQVFDIIKRESETKREGSVTANYLVVDSKGDECSIVLTQYTDAQKQDTLTIRYKKKGLTYIYKMDCPGN